MSYDRCLLPGLPPPNPALPHHRLAHHVAGRIRHHVGHRAPTTLRAVAEPDGCTKHFSAGHPGELADRPTDGLPAEGGAAKASGVGGKAAAVAVGKLAGLAVSTAAAGALGMAVIHPFGHPPALAASSSLAASGPGSQVTGTAPVSSGSAPVGATGGSGFQAQDTGSRARAPIGAGTAVPEPSSAMLLGGAVGLALGVRCLRARRRTKLA